MDQAYTKREIDMKFNSLEEKNDAWSATIIKELEEIKKSHLVPILEQVKKTNGRVDELEKKSAAQGGGIKVIAYFGSFVLLLTVSFLTWLFGQVQANTIQNNLDRDRSNFTRIPYPDI